MKLKTIGLLFYIALVVGLSTYFFTRRKIKNFDNDAPITNTGNVLDFTGNTSDVKSITGDIFTGMQNFTGLDVEVSDIDKVYSILENGKPGIDYSVISPLPQKIVYNSTTVQQDFLNYLSMNTKSLPMPADIQGGWLYIKTNKPLKYMANINAFQPITLKTNIYFKSRQTYGRLDTSKSLGVYLENQEFLYDLENVPIRNAKGSNWLSMKGKSVVIGGFVSDTSGNYIEKVIFIWQR